MHGSTPPDWFPDPFGRYELRYWDGREWTQHVSLRGDPSIDPPVGSPTGAQASAQVPANPEPSSPAPIPYPLPTPSGRGRRRIRRQIERAGVTGAGPVGGGTMLSEPILVVNQKAKLVEINAEYAVYNQHGHQVGAVREVGKGVLSDAASLIPTASARKTLEIVDHNRQVMMTLVRPAKVARSKVIVRDAHRVEVGQIVQKNLGVVGRVRFDLVSRGHKIGTVRADSWGAWDFTVQDSAGTDVAVVTKSRALQGLVALTKKDKYVLEIYGQLDEPLRSLVVATALAIDTALRQNH